MSSIPFHPLDVPPNGIMGFITNAVSSLGATGSFSHFAGALSAECASVYVHLTSPLRREAFFRSLLSLRCLPCIYERSMTNADLKLNLLCRHLTRARPCPESSWAFTDTLLLVSVGLSSWEKTLLIPSLGTKAQLAQVKGVCKHSPHPYATRCPLKWPWSKTSILLSLENNPPSSAGVGKRHLGWREKMWGQITYFINTFFEQPSWS